MSETKIRPALRLVGARDTAPERPASSVLVRAPSRPGAVEGGGARIASAADRVPSAVGALPEQWWTRPETVEAKIQRENESAAAMSPTDARWVLAVRVAESLDGGKAAVLGPERRRRLVSLATRLGLRPFDANLVIAIVQDAARSGGRPLGPDVAGRLALIPRADLVPAEADNVAQRGGVSAVWRVAAPVGAAVALATVLLRGLIGWVTG